MKRSIFNIVFLWVSVVNTFGQKIDTLLALLNQRSYVGVDSFCSRVASKSAPFNIIYRTGVNRQIVDSFYEISFEYQEIQPSRQKGTFDVHPYQVSVITRGDDIIYCKMLNNYHMHYAKTEVHFASVEAIRVLQLAYKSLYDRSIEVSDLFSDQVVYGSNCGWGGDDPDYRLKMNKLVETKNINELDGWLRSPVTELQVYAVEGFYQLSQHGFKVNPARQKLIAIIKSKKGTIRTCRGCVYSSRSISYSTWGFKF